MSDTKATLVVTAIPNPEAMDDMQTYLKRVGPILMSHGGSMVYRGKTNKALAGNVTFGMLLVMNFDSTETIENLFASPEYQELIPYRNKGFKKIDIVISSAL
ncbi:MAG: DUF1330 domain-containing protein [FCB group bacterium]|nr:DUF1330 domain-containing protein [FCB group bacterium]